MQIPRSVTVKRLRAESFVASFRVGAQEAEETALSRNCMETKREKDREREKKRMEEDGTENDQTSRRGTEPSDTVKPRRKGEEETEVWMKRRTKG